MTKHGNQRVGSRPAARHLERKPNWPLVGAVIAAGVILLSALLYLALREPQLLSLEEYCADNEGYCIATGPDEAPVTIVEVSDYTCPACREFNEQTAEALLSDYVQTGQVHYLVLPYARQVAEAEARPAVEAAYCANEQGRFFDYHRALFSLQDEESITQEGILRVAGEVGLDTEAFTTCLDGGQYAAMVTANMAAALDAGVQATPTFFINDSKMEGAHPLASFAQRIEALAGS
jgi:protein-disulfide isomerase